MKITTHWLSFEKTNRVGIYLVQWLDLSSVGVTQEISLMLASSVDSFVFLNPFCIQYAPSVFAWDIFMVRAQVLSIMATSQKGNCCFFVFRFCFSCCLLEVVSFMCSSVFHSPWEKLRLYIFFFLPDFHFEIKSIWCHTLEVSFVVICGSLRVFVIEKELMQLVWTIQFKCVSHHSH